MMNENTITVPVPLEEYKELVTKAERIATIERMANSNSYFCMCDFYTILGINVKEEQKIEAI